LIFDIPTAFALLDIVFRQEEGGLCGTAASFISLYEIYGS
jgi:hypothetical protein